MVQYDGLRQAVVDGHAPQATEMVKQSLDSGSSPQDVLDLALIPAMDIVGEKFSKGELFIPEMMLAARAMQAGLAVLKPLLAVGEARVRGKVVIGTVKGDLHDIGKNLVAMMLQGGGFQVVDLGTDVEPERFVEVVREEHPDFLMMSALLTTTMVSMRETVQALEKAGLRQGVRVAVGGAPVTQRFADQIGADFYGADAARTASWTKQVAGAQV